MQSNLDYLVLHVEITMAFVAFATIVATLRQAFSGYLARLQKPTVSFFRRSRVSWSHNGSRSHCSVHYLTERIAGVARVDICDLGSDRNVSTALHTPSKKD